MAKNKNVVLALVFVVSLAFSGVAFGNGGGTPKGLALVPQQPNRTITGSFVANKKDKGSNIYEYQLHYTLHYLKITRDLNAKIVKSEDKEYKTKKPVTGEANNTYLCKYRKQDLFDQFMHLPKNQKVGDKFGIPGTPKLVNIKLGPCKCRPDNVVEYEKKAFEDEIITGTFTIYVEP